VAHSEVDKRKDAVRRSVWGLLDREGVVVGGSSYGYIPDFVGADEAAARLGDLPVWTSARVIKSVPDKAQLPARVRALRDGKTVYMAVPKLAGLPPFYLLDPAHLAVPPEEAAASRTAETIARRVGLDEMAPVDLVLCGSVAVTPRGARLGKGAGYSDIEVALLQESALIGPETTIVTTVHDLQVIDDDLPETEHDFRVDLIVTPTEVIACGPPKRPAGLLWEHLSPDKIAAIPILAARAPK